VSCDIHHIVIVKTQNSKLEYIRIFGLLRPDKDQIYNDIFREFLAMIAFSICLVIRESLDVFQ
jgi:hypothetical protein